MSLADRSIVLVELDSISSHFKQPPVDHLLLRDVMIFAHRLWCGSWDMLLFGGPVLGARVESFVVGSFSSSKSIASYRAVQQAKRHVCFISGQRCGSSILYNRPCCIRFAISVQLSTRVILRIWGTVSRRRWRPPPRIEAGTTTRTGQQKQPGGRYFRRRRAWPKEAWCLVASSEF